MKSSKQRTGTFAAPPDDVHNALLGLIQNGTFTIIGVQNEHRRFAFAAGMSALSWGTQYLAEVATTGDQTTLTVISGSPEGAPSALLDGWKNRKAADKIIGQVRTELASGSIAPVQEVESFAMQADGSTVPWTGPEWPVK